MKIKNDNIEEFKKDSKEIAKKLGWHPDLIRWIIDENDNIITDFKKFIKKNDKKT